MNTPAPAGHGPEFHRQLNRRQRRALEKAARKAQKQREKASAAPPARSPSAPAPAASPPSGAPSPAADDPARCTLVEPDFIGEPDSLESVLDRVLTFLPFERACFGGHVPRGRLFALAIRELARCSLEALCVCDDDAVRTDVTARVINYEARFDLALERQRSAFPENYAELEPATAEEEREALGQITEWFELAMTIRNPRAFFGRILRDDALLESLLASECPRRTALPRIRAMAVGFWDLVNAPVNPRARLKLASSLFRSFLVRRDWMLSRQRAWENLEKAKIRVLKQRAGVPADAPPPPMPPAPAAEAFDAERAPPR